MTLSWPVWKSEEAYLFSWGAACALQRRRNSLTLQTCEFVVADDENRGCLPAPHMHIDQAIVY